MKSVTVALCRHECETLKKIAEEKFPFFSFLSDDEKVKAAIEYLVEREVASNGYQS